MALIQDLLDPGVAAISAAVVTAAITMNLAFFRWLGNKFNTLEQEIDNLTKVDLVRHEANIYRFERIAVALAKLGVDNGTKGK